MYGIYAEAVLIDNFLVNSLILYVSAIFGRQKIVFGRILLSGAAGAVWAVLQFVPGMEWMYYCKLLMPVLLARIAFGESFKSVLINALYILAAAFLFGGACLAAGYATHTLTLQNGVFVLQGFPLRALLAGCLGTIALVRILRTRTRGEITALVQMRLFGCDITTQALVDSGLTAYQPLDASPVMIIQADFLPEELDIWAQPKMVPIPYSSMGNENGVLPGYRAQALFINKIWRGDIWVAIYSGSLGRYKAIVPFDATQNRGNEHETH